mmetsp:Transcript_8810/g.25269  ORF Transcript_8810/g.25269 Transcript_8810/m.25269 type:complete len:205 (+) Transcript_8810:939-1553(+)
MSGVLEVSDRPRVVLGRLCAQHVTLPLPRGPAGRLLVERRRCFLYGPGRGVEARHHRGHLGGFGRGVGLRPAGVEKDDLHLAGDEEQIQLLEVLFCGERRCLRRRDGLALSASTARGRGVLRRLAASAIRRARRRWPGHLGGAPPRLVRTRGGLRLSPHLRLVEADRRRSLQLRGSREELAWRSSACDWHRDQHEGRVGPPATC